MNVHDIREYNVPYKVDTAANIAEYKADCDLNWRRMMDEMLKNVNNLIDAGRVADINSSYVFCG